MTPEVGFNADGSIDLLGVFCVFLHVRLSAIPAWKLRFPSVLTPKKPLQNDRVRGM